MSCFSVAFPTKSHFIHVEQQPDNRPNIPYWLWIWGSLVISFRPILCFYITLLYTWLCTQSWKKRYKQRVYIVCHTGIPVRLRFFLSHFLFSRPDHTGYFISQFRVRFARVNCSLSCEIGEDTLMQKNNNSKKKFKR